MADPTGKLIEPRDPATGGKLPRPAFNTGYGVGESNQAKEVWTPDLKKYTGAPEGSGA